MGFKIKNSLTGEFEKLPILTLKGEKGETGGVEEYNKVDYMGNKYETLKQANDANVEYAVKTAIGEFNYLDYEGQNITATDSIAGQAKNAVVKGQTLVNLASKQIIDYTATSDWDGFKALGQNSATQESWRVLQDLKPNTKYFISCYVETFNVGENQGYLLNNPNNSTVFAEFLEVKATGLHKWVLTSKSEFTKEVSIALRCQNKNARGAIKIRDVMIIEYQDGMENWDIPYFEGMTSVKAPVLKSVGKNLYPFDDINFMPTNLNTWYMSNGVPQSRWGKELTHDCGIGEWFYIDEGYYSISRKTTYNFNFHVLAEGEKIVASSGENNRLFSSGWYTIRVKSSPDTLKNINFSNIQIEKGAVNTDYEPYKSNTLSTPEDLELRGIGNVKDELNVATGELTQRFTNIVVDGVNYKIIKATVNNDNTRRFDLNFSFEKFVGEGNWVALEKMNASVISDKAVCIHDGFSAHPNRTAIASYNGIPVLFIEDKTALSIEQANQWLQQNPITIQYELKTPTVKTVDLSDNHVYSYQGTTHYDCSSAEGSLVPTLSVKVPTDVQATIAQQRETIQTLNSENERLNQIQEALKASMLDSQVQLMNLSWDIDFEVFTLRESIAPKDFLLDSRTGSNIDKFSQAKFIIENDCPDLEKLNSQIEYYFSKDVFSQEQFEELTDLISIVKGKMVVNIKSINVTTSKSNEEVMPKLGNYLYAAKTLTLAVSQDTNIFINGSVEPVLVKSKYGLSIPVDMKMTIGSIIVESENTEVYAVFAY